MDIRRTALEQFGCHSGRASEASESRNPVTTELPFFAQWSKDCTAGVYLGPRFRRDDSSIVTGHATPARRRSWKWTMPTGLPASATMSAVIFEELMISKASLAS